MAVSRRNALIGLGALVGGAGVFAATGAFTTVEAQREVSIEAAGDDSALIGFRPTTNQDMDDSDNHSGNAPTVFSDIGDDDIVELEIDELNLNARTTFDAGLTVTNTGENDVGLYIDESDSHLTLEHSGDGRTLSVDVLDHNGDSIVGDDDDSVQLDSGEFVILGFEIDLWDLTSTTDVDDIFSDDGPMMLNIVADQDAY